MRSRCAAKAHCKYENACECVNEGFAHGGGGGDNEPTGKPSEIASDSNCISDMLSYRIDDERTSAACIVAENKNDSKFV